MITVNPAVAVGPLPDATRRRSRRPAFVGVAATLLIAAGGYGTARTLGHEPAHQSPSPRAAREMDDVIAHLYGPRAATGAPNRHDDSVTRELRETTIALYGPQH